MGLNASLFETCSFGVLFGYVQYTTNPIESYHRMVRKVTKTKGAFSSENAILKQVYLAIWNAQIKWTGPFIGLLYKMI